jgi:putrescine aminotransferase
MDKQDHKHEVWQQDRDHFVHPWTHFDSFKIEGSLIIDKAEGSVVYDMDGKRYLDGIGGLWCVNIGYGREEMANAIAEQVRKLAFFNPFVDTTNIPASKLAAKLAELAPGDLNHVFYSSGGSTANETAYRLIQFYQRCRGKNEKRHVIAREEAYHGSTYIAQSLSAKSMDRVPEFEYLTETIHHISAPNMYRRPENMSEAAYCDHLIQEFEDKIEELGADRIAAFFAEPVMGSGGVLIAPAGYLKRMWETCQRHDILFVADEVVTAFGRLGHWFASKDIFDVEPDIIVSAKGLTSGYLPLGVTIFSDRIYDVISAPNPDRWFTHGFTYSGHPVCCAAALKNIEIIEREGILDTVCEVGRYFLEQLNTLSELPMVGDVRGSHFMACVEFVADKETKAMLPDSINIGKLISNECESRGLIVRPVAHLNVLSPPLTISREQCDEIVGILRESILAVAKSIE